MSKKFHSFAEHIVLSRWRDGSLVVVDDGADDGCDVIVYMTPNLLEEQSLPKGSIGTVLESRASWVKILCGDSTYWVYTEWLRPT